MNKKILISILVIFSICCVLMVALTIAGVVVFKTASPLVSSTVVVQKATPISKTPQPTLPSVGNLPSSVSKQMDSIQQQVDIIRGLTLTNPIQRGVLTNDQLKEKVTDDFFSDYTKQNAADDVRVLSSFGLLAPDFNLYQLFMDLYSEQVAGYYDPKTKEMFVVQSSTFSGVERMTYAHEFTHALQDQAYDLQNGLKSNAEYCKDHSEYCSAVQALVEGDASLTEQLWFMRYATSQDRSDVQNFAQSYSSPVFDSAPAFLQQDFYFPYKQGQEFVQYLYDKGGYAAIDKAFANPPVDTSQILHPERYPDVKPTTVTLPDLSPVLGSGWREIDRNEMGEWYTYLILAYGRDKKFRLTDSTARSGSQGWAGDQYVVYGKDSSKDTVVVLRTNWQTKNDANNAWSALSEYGSDRWGKPAQSKTNRLEWTNTSEGYVAFLRSGQETLWLMAPDANTAEQVLAQINGFSGF